MNRLYHFTAREFGPEISADGLIMGQVPVKVNNLIAYLPDTQWLTKNGDFNQTWATDDYPRNELRLTIELAGLDPRKLYTWAKFRRLLRGHLLHDFGTHPDASNWFIYHGVIPPANIIGAFTRPEGVKPIIELAKDKRDFEFIDFDQKNPDSIVTAQITGHDLESGEAITRQTKRYSDD